MYDLLLGKCLHFVMAGFIIVGKFNILNLNLIYWRKSGIAANEVIITHLYRETQRHFAFSDPEFIERRSRDVHYHGKREIV